MPQESAAEKPKSAQKHLLGVLIPGLFVLMLLAGCSVAPMNAPLEGPRKAEIYSMANSVRPLGPSRLMVVLYFSGGGSRAAALGYGVLRELSQTPLPTGGRMLDQVCSISAVSGGCFPAAYYCLYGERVFKDFESSFLHRDIQGELYARCFGLPGLLRLASNRLARSDVAAEFFDDLLFQKATFGDLEKLGNKRPVLVINATNITNGEPFQFVQEQFDLIGSDLNSYPLSRAVAASAAFPVLLTPITLRNYSDRVPPPPVDAPNPEKGLSIFTGFREDITQSMQVYRDAAQHPYLHLMDGGLSDNLGLKGMLNQVALQGGWSNVMEFLRHSGSDKIALIVVNAETRMEQDWDKSPVTPTTSTVIRAMSHALVNQSNRDMITSVKTSLRLWQEQRQALRAPGEAEDPRVYFVNVSFKDIADAAERERFNRIPTRYTIDRKDADRVVAKAGELLRASPDFQELLQVLRKEAAH